MAELVAELRGAHRQPHRRRGRGRRSLDRTPPGTRQASGPRAHRSPHRPGVRLPRAVRPCRRWALRRRRPGGRDGDRDRHRRGRGMRDRRQRRDREGRHVLPAHRQEAPPRAGDRAREPPAVPLPRRLRRGVPADAGRGVSRSRPLRADLLQPGAALRPWRPADRARDGELHRRRRLRPRDVRRDGHRAGHRHDLPRRPAAREGGHRRGGERGGPRRGGGPHDALGRGRPLRARRRPRPRHRSLDRRQPRPAQACAPLGDRGAASAVRSGR